jgi:serine/threonine protein kinase
MPRAEGVTLEELSSTELGYYSYPRHNDKLGQEWQRFDRNSPDSLVLRLKLCSNIAKAIHTLHASGHYVIGDLKPQNIMVLPNGLVSILDLDSCQIADQGSVRFESKMNTPEFNPPENPGRKKEVSWDLFIIGIIFYKLLSGVHPFFGTCKTPYENCTLPELKIKEGLFPHGSKGQFFEVIPVGHNAFNEFPEFVQKLFINCFDGGVTKPSLRPTALDWINKLTAKPSIKFFKADKEIIFDTQKFTLSWETENGRTAEVEGFGTVELNGSLQLAAIGQSFFKLKISNEFGDTLQDLSITRFPTPVIESLKVPTPTFESRLNLSPITIQSPNINVSINFEPSKLSQATASLTKLNDDIQNATPLIKKETAKWSSISKLFDELKIRINNI